MSTGHGEGVISGLNQKGFGFITVEGRKSNLFFHAKDLVGIKFDELREGDRLAFSHVDTTDRGDAAKMVELVGEVA